MVVLGKANLSEWANIRDGSSASGWSGYGGLTRNPYALNRSAGGSSSGSGAAVARRHHAVRRGHRDRRLHLLPGGVQRLRRDQADGGPGADRRRGADLPVAGLPRPDGGDGARRGGAARRARRQRHRLRVVRRGRPARREADRGPAGEVLGLQQPRRRARRAGRAAAGRRGRDDRGRHRPHQHGGLRRARRAAGHAGRAARRAGGLPRRPARRRPRTPRRRGRLEPRARRRRARSTSASRCSSRRWRDRASTAGSTPRRGPAACGPDATTASTPCCARTTWTRWSPRPTARPCRSTWSTRRRTRAPAPQPSAIAGYPLLTVPAGLAAGLPVAVSFWGTAASETDPGRDRRGLRGRPRPGHGAAAGADLPDRSSERRAGLLHQRRRAGEQRGELGGDRQRLAGRRSRAGSPRPPRRPARPRRPRRRCRGS